MTTVEPRIAERRRQVTEDRARRRLVWMVAVLIVIVLAALGYWFSRSPFLSLEAVDVQGARHVDVAGIADAAGAVPGIPLLSIDEEAIQRALLAEPWVRAVDVRVRWPKTLAITVDERRQVAVVTDGDVYGVVAGDGTVVATVTGATDAIRIDTVVPAPGSRIRDEAVLGAVAFLDALDDDLAATTVVTIEAGSVSALVDGHPVRLGRAVDMAAKARSLQAVLEVAIAPGAHIDLIAPSAPAVVNPQALVEGEDESQPQGEPED